MIWEIRGERPFYGTRRVAVEMSRRLGRVVNRMTIRRIYKRMGWDEPRRMRAAKVRWTPIKADSPNEVWETDTTYVWCGQVAGWCFCLNILDIFA